MEEKMWEKVRVWADEALARGVRFLLVLCGEKSMVGNNALVPLGCVRAKSMSAFLSAANVSSALAAVYIMPDAAIDEARHADRWVGTHNVTYDDPKMCSLLRKTQDWAKAMRARHGDSARLFIVQPKREPPLLYGAHNGFVPIYEDADLKSTLYDEGHFQAAFICPGVSDEARFEAEEAAEEVWVEDGERPEKKGLIPRPGDGVINGLRIPRPTFSLPRQDPTARRRDIRCVYVHTALELPKDNDLRFAYLLPDEPVARVKFTIPCLRGEWKVWVTSWSEQKSTHVKDKTHFRFELWFEEPAEWDEFCKVNRDIIDERVANQKPPVPIGVAMHAAEKEQPVLVQVGVACEAIGGAQGIRRGEPVHLTPTGEVQKVGVGEEKGAGRKWEAGEDYLREHLLSPSQALIDHLNQIGSDATRDRTYLRGERSRAWMQAALVALGKMRFDEEKNGVGKGEEKISSPRPTIDDFAQALELAALMLPMDQRRHFNFDKRFRALCNRLDEIRGVSAGESISTMMEKTLLTSLTPSAFSQLTPPSPEAIQAALDEGRPPDIASTMPYQNAPAESADYGTLYTSSGNIRLPGVAFDIDPHAARKTIVLRSRVSVGVDTTVIKWFMRAGIDEWTLLSLPGFRGQWHVRIVRRTIDETISAPNMLNVHLDCQFASDEWAKFLATNKEAVANHGKEPPEQRPADPTAAPTPWNTCPKCKQLADVPDECSPGARFVCCNCGIELYADVFDGDVWHLLDAAEVDADDAPDAASDEPAQAAKAAGMVADDGNQEVRLHVTQAPASEAKGEAEGEERVMTVEKWKEKWWRGVDGAKFGDIGLPVPVGNGTWIRCAPGALRDLEYVRELEQFDGPILTELRDKNGDVFLEKWCTYDKRIMRSLFVRSTKEAIAAYLDHGISMLQLLTAPNHDVGFIVDREGPAIHAVYLCLVSTLPTSYLPMPDCMHEPSLRPDADGDDAVAAAVEATVVDAQAGHQHNQAAERAPVMSNDGYVYSSESVMVAALRKEHAIEVAQLRDRVAKLELKLDRLQPE